MPVQEGNYTRRRGQLPFKEISTLPQMRLTFNDETIAGLAESIAIDGLRVPIDVFYRTKRSRRAIAIAGHRRRAAVGKLIADGRWPKERPVDVVIYENATPFDIAYLQASENTHEPVPPHEAATFYASSWTIIRAADKNYPFNYFCRRMGRSESTVRDAIRYMELPTAVQRLVARGDITYGSAVQLAPLLEVINEDELIWWARSAYATGETVSQTRKRVQTYLGQVRSGQTSMLDLFEANQRAALDQQARQMRIELAICQAFWSQRAYLERLLHHLDRENIPREDVLWLRRRPRVALAALLDLLAKIAASAATEEALGKKACTLLKERVENVGALMAN
ncbi:MAG: ParB/RepB/Spo0J family partition protein [Candidatus Spechtbacterales bacterium]